MTLLMVPTSTMTSASETDIRAAARAFAQALAETSQFRVLDQAGEALDADLPAQQSVAVYQTK